MTTCSLRLDGEGLSVDGRASDIATAIARCHATGRAELVLADDAPSGACSQLATAFERAGIVIMNPRRNARARPRASRRQAAPRYTREARTILRDGQPIVTIQRIDLGDERFAITPHETDRLSQRIVDLLNGKRPRPARNATEHRIFVLRTYPKNGEVQTRWYHADPPTTWEDGKRRLVYAGVLDDRVVLPTDWKLVGDPPFRVPEGRLRPLP